MDYERFFVQELPRIIEIVLKTSASKAIKSRWVVIQEKLKLLTRDISDFTNVWDERSQYIQSRIEDTPHYVEVRNPNIREELQRLMEYYTNNILRTGLINDDFLFLGDGILNMNDEFLNEVRYDFQIDFLENPRCNLPPTYDRKKTIYWLIKEFLADFNVVRRDTLPDIFSLINGNDVRTLKQIIVNSAKGLKILARHSPCTDSSQCFPYDCGAYTKGGATYCKW